MSEIEVERERDGLTMRQTDNEREKKCNDE